MLALTLSIQVMATDTEEATQVMAMVMVMEMEEATRAMAMVMVMDMTEDMVMVVHMETEQDMV